MNQELLAEKIQAMRQLRSLGAAADRLPDFERALGTLAAWSTFRINPLSFAESHGLDPGTAVSLFIHGARVGLFTLEWTLLCPLCGGREHSYGSLNQLDQDAYHCTLCDVDVEVEADSHLEVSFTVPSALSGFHPSPFGSEAGFWAYFFSPHISWAPELQAEFDRQPALTFVSLGPHASELLTLPAPRAKLYRVGSPETHSIFTVRLGGRDEGLGPTIEIAHGERGFDRREQSVGATRAQLRITNTSDRPFACLVGSPDSPALQAVIAHHPPQFKPFLSGKMVLNDQTFRDLYLVDELPDDLSLKIRDITLLFTDLKGSTELYDSVGDVDAYRLVQRHFELLQGVVHGHHGGIVKTMGDAIMASFNVPSDGLRAAFSMLDEVDSFNRASGHADRPLGLKIGIHRGSAIAVKANQTLDFFGQTVNIAARIQALASAGEIWLTDEVAQDRLAARYLAATSHALETREVELKGVGSRVRAHRCSR